MIHLPANRCSEEVPESIVLPEQWHQQPGDHKWTPEQKLCWAVLFDAIYAIRRTKDRWEAVEWFASDARGPFTFLTVCENIELEPNRVRLWIRGPMTGMPTRRFGRCRSDLKVSANG